MEIRRCLNAGDVLPRNGKIWSKVTIQHIITFGGYATGEYTTTLDGEVFTVSCPPIISMATWRKAQEVRAGNKKYRGRNVKEDYLCRGMIVCPCGWKRQWVITQARKGRITEDDMDMQLATLDLQFVGEAFRSPGFSRFCRKLPPFLRLKPRLQSL